MIGNPITDVFRSYFQSLAFELTTDSVDAAEKAAAEDEAQEADERQRRQAETWARPRQALFRRQVFERYGAICLVTGCRTILSLEAAHVLPVAKGGTDKAWNGIPLRADIHRLLDAGTISIDPDTWTLNVDEDVLDDYGQYHGLELGYVLADRKGSTLLAEALRARGRI
ncbi:MAG: HNH endonuclease [Alteromonadaceae bacterium]|nr:HNH endonuclease [Alteromonadaceae bacterium]